MYLATRVYMPNQTQKTTTREKYKYKPYGLVIHYRLPGGVSQEGGGEKKRPYYHTLYFLRINHTYF